MSSTLHLAPGGAPTAGPPTQTSVVLDELDQHGRVVRLDQAAASALADTGLVEVQPRGGDEWLLLPCGRVGAVCSSDLQVQVNPKESVGVSKLIFLLGYAADPGFRPEEVCGGDEPELWAALAESLARLAERALARGVPHGYRTVDESLRTVRGRIRMGDQISRRPGLMIPLEVSHDEFTPDIAENRILRSALRRMLGVPRIGVDMRARLAHLDARLPGVTPLRPRELPPRWFPSRLNERCQPALRLAEVILRNVSAQAGPGGVPVAAFVVSMWKVFEDFVTTALAEALRHFPGTTHAQYPSSLDEPRPGRTKGDIPMRVDVAHVLGGRPVLVFDAKYKAAGSRNYPNADQYQMLAYCTALRLNRAWLIYAQGDSAPVERQVRNSPVRIVEYPLDLGNSPLQILSQIDTLARTAWHHSCDDCQ